MKTKLKISLAAVLLSLVSLGSSAEDKYAEALAKLTGELGFTVTTIEPSPVPGLLQAFTNRGLFYVSENGQFLLHGRVFNLNEGLRNETEEALSALRLEGIKGFNGSAISFKAKNEKYQVSVFTDITCGYCRKLHSQIDEYNRLGITVNYLAFPRGGPGSEGFENMISVWCAENRQEALTMAKAGKSVKGKSCPSKVGEQYDFGQQIGIQGTPAIILDDGSMIPGYQPPEQLAEILRENHS
ncbi:bifunctional protein-disulfide isomerase/oxidoreductase DsbC [Aliiglaciecola sp. CAU 1673]|uniref:bifunctional protein-disulfide isomerase/oxidoreductase DsbC n=1 Tax=Aliiglaciecola sp. CAU 1673 TaxID=3032595 RepID=UPI0023DA3C29|nr:bifunctional protein-disulfide isomerase/oxidoreductase DsbC [Aliiglaciecola sp. CAU 1673]MDF2178350.1 bifunctional protein-disulfide isomerase/oxidoreductase DsbC [Aliiglaciecola sp. CAU 1673]